MPEKISIKDAAEAMGKSQQFVRVGLQRGAFPFGTAIKLSSIWTYYISPKKFYEYTGTDVIDAREEQKFKDKKTKKGV